MESSSSRESYLMEALEGSGSLEWLGLREVGRIGGFCEEKKLLSFTLSHLPRGIVLPSKLPFGLFSNGLLSPQNTRPFHAIIWYSCCGLNWERGFVHLSAWVLRWAPVGTIVDSLISIRVHENLRNSCLNKHAHVCEAPEATHARITFQTTADCRRLLLKIMLELGLLKWPTLLACFLLNFMNSSFKWWRIHGVCVCVCTRLCTEGLECETPPSQLPQG